MFRPESLASWSRAPERPLFMDFASSERLLIIIALSGLSLNKNVWWFSSSSCKRCPNTVFWPNVVMNCELSRRTQLGILYWLSNTAVAILNTSWNWVRNNKILLCLYICSDAGQMCRTLAHTVADACENNCCHAALPNLWLREAHMQE